MQSIEVGALPHDNTGDALRNAFLKVNANFLKLFAKEGFTISTTAPDPAEIKLYWNPVTGIWYVWNVLLETPAWVPAFSGGSGGGKQFFNQDTTPVGANLGDDWYAPIDGVMYTLIDDDGNLVWADV